MCSVTKSVCVVLQSLKVELCLGGHSMLQRVVLQHILYYMCCVTKYVKICALCYIICYNVCVLCYRV